MNDANPDSNALQLPACDLSHRSVRVQRRRANGFVEFEFSVGWPELVVELAMPEADFQEFCETQQARLL
ncbi:phenol hydroxylase subunit [Diaphorobacter ruginosibacter]|uniref:phenol hydroxylase subunit n=1 Tax=Diaphorobacter ruginosibacter TaxID=1715720 RepID=UPI00334069F9